jgi:hypothetical protein
MKTSISKKECSQMDELYHESAKKFYSDDKQRKKRKIKNNEDSNSSSPDSVINNSDSVQLPNYSTPSVNFFFGEGTTKVNNSSLIEFNNVSDQIIQIISKKQKFTTKDIEIHVNNTTEGNLDVKISLSAHFKGI